MKKNEYLLGWLLLAAAGAGVYFLFHSKPAVPDEAEPDIVTEVPVHIGSIQQADLHQFIEAFGKIDTALPANGAALSQMPATSSVNGILTEITPSCSLGATVKKEQVLFRLDSRIADVELTQAKTRSKFAQQQLDRVKKLFDAQTASQKDYQQALLDFHEAQKAVESARIKHSYLTIRAPITGTIVSLAAIQGSPVTTGQTLAEIRDTTRLFVTAQVPAAQAAGLRLNQPAKIIVPQDNNTGSFTEHTYTGKVVYIDSQVNPQTGSVTVQVQLNSVKQPKIHNLKKGLLVRLQIEQAVHHNCLTADVEAVVRDPEGKSYIAVVKEKTARRRYIGTGFRQGNRIEIIDSTDNREDKKKNNTDKLRAGMLIVTKGVYGLPEKTAIRVIKDENK